MPIVVNCPACALACTVADQWIGHPVACPCCGFSLEETIAELYGEYGETATSQRSQNSLVWLVAAGGGAFALACVLLIVVSTLFRRAPEPVANRGDATVLPQAHWQPAPAAAPASQASANAPVAPAVSPIVLPAAPAEAGGAAASKSAGNASPSPGAPKMKRWNAAPGGRLGMNREEEAAVPAEWQSSVDPPAEPVAFDATRKYHIAFPGEAHQTALVRPATASPFAALRSGRGAEQDWDLWNLVEAKRVASLKQIMMGDDKCALSPDGRYLAATDTFKKLIYIWNLRDGESVGILELEKDAGSLNSLFFASDAQLSCIFDVRRETGAQWITWKLPEGTPESTRKLPGYYSRTAAVSPGGKYLAVIISSSTNALRVYDTTTGEVRGEVFLPRGEHSLHVNALSFSPDGAELAAISDESHDANLLCWDMASGELTAQIAMKDSLRDRLSSGHSNADRWLQWFPDRRRWLVGGRVIIDREVQGPVFRLPDTDHSGWGEQPVVLDNETLLVAAGASRQRVLTTYKIKGDELARGVDNYKRGGRQSDEKLPPLTPPDMSQVAEVSGIAEKWQVKPDPAPPAKGKLLARPIDLKEGSGAIFFSRRDVGKALIDSTVWETPGFHMPRNPFADMGRPHRISIYDLTSGKQLKSVPLAHNAETLAFSPDGNRIAVLPPEGRDRVDVLDFSTEKHVAGWRPYLEELEKSDQRFVGFGNQPGQVAEADFIDSEHVLTRNAAGRLVLWQTPACKAIWAATSRVYAVSPNRKYVVLVNDDTVKFIDALSGEIQGELDAGGHVNALAFDASGKRLATSASAAANQVIQTWNLTDGVQDDSFLIAKSGSQLQWCGDGHLFLDQRYLVSLRRGMVVWKYEAPIGARSGESPDGRYWYIAHRAGIGGTPYSLNAIDLPDPIASLRLTALGPRRDLAVGPGTSLSLKANLPTITDRPNYANDVRQSITRKFAANQISVADGQPVALELSYTSGATGETLYQADGAFSFFQKPKPGAPQLAEMKVECRAAITLDGKALWERNGRYTTPTGSFRLKPGESVEAHVNQLLWQHAAGFFEHLELPAEVLASGKDEGFGVSTLARGAAVPKEETPQGAPPRPMP